MPATITTIVTTVYDTDTREVIEHTAVVEVSGEETVPEDMPYIIFQAGIAVAGGAASSDPGLVPYRDAIEAGLNGVDAVNALADGRDHEPLTIPYTNPIGDSGTY